MAEILGLGVTHWPTLCLPNEGLTSVFKRTLTAPNVEARYKNPANWPDELIAELGNDDGLSAANRCGERFGNDFRAIRKILDDFNPDLVVIWGDVDPVRASEGLAVMAANPTAGTSLATGR